MRQELLTPDIVLKAYCAGYFPMPEPQTQEILWYRPDPRAIIPLDRFHISRSFKRVLNKGLFRATFNHCFSDVMNHCANRPQTWISERFKIIYPTLHRMGFCHSIEVWDHDSKLVGGLYGLCIAGAFFAESMFHTQTGASKFALMTLVNEMKACGLRLLEVQFLTPHLASQGAIVISDEEYQHMLREALSLDLVFPQNKI